MEYPSDWYVWAVNGVPPDAFGYNAAIFSTFRLGSLGQHGGIPSGSAKVDVELDRRGSSDCGSNQSDATDAVVGGVDGWRFENRELEERDDLIAVAHGAALDEWCFQIIGYFAPDSPYSETLEEMVASLKFGS